MKWITYPVLMACLFLGTVHCGDDGGDDGDDGGGNGSSSGSVQSCDDLCGLAPVDSQTATCVSGYVTLHGYDTSDPACNNASTNTPQGCRACYDAIAVSDGDCVGAHNSCF